MTALLYDRQLCFVINACKATSFSPRVSFKGMPPCGRIDPHCLVFPRFKSIRFEIDTPEEESDTWYTRYVLRCVLMRVRSSVLLGGLEASRHHVLGDKEVHPFIKSDNDPKPLYHRTPLAELPQLSIVFTSPQQQENTKSENTEGPDPQLTKSRIERVFDVLDAFANLGPIAHLNIQLPTNFKLEHLGRQENIDDILDRLQCALDRIQRSVGHDTAAGSLLRSR